jgi:hypothetical protein
MAASSINVSRFVECFMCLSETIYCKGVTYSLVRFSLGFISLSARSLLLLVGVRTAAHVHDFAERSR